MHRHEVLAIPSHEQGFPASDFFPALSEKIAVALEPGDHDVQAFKSKKHKVFLVSRRAPRRGNQPSFPDAFVVKVFEPGAEAEKEREAAFLARAMERGPRVPRVLATLDRFLILEHVEGTVASDLINGESSADEKDAVASNIGAWLGDFHHSFRVGDAWTMRGDSNLRNFIVNKGTTSVTGLDLEEAGKGDPSNDVHEMIDSILITNPGIYTTVFLEHIRWKFTTCSSFLDAYYKKMEDNGHISDRDLDDFLDRLIATMYRLSSRRNARDIFMKVERELREMLHHELRSCFITF